MGVAQEVSRGLPRDAVGPARTIAFGTSIVAPSASAVTVLVLLLAYARFASPLVVLITFAGSLCCALSFGEFAGRLPSAGWAYTYNSRGLGPSAGFLTGWMMIFGYVLFVPAGVALTATFGSLLVASTLHVTVSPWILFLVVLAAAGLVAYLGVSTSSAVDLVLVAGEMAVIAALAITILVKIGPGALLAQGVLSGVVAEPAARRHHRCDDLRHHGLRRLRGGRRAR